LRENQSLVRERESLARKATENKNMRLLLLLLVTVTVVGTTAPAAHAWGRDGHYMICKIAEVITGSHRMIFALTVSSSSTSNWTGNELLLYVWQSFLTEETSTAVKDLLPGWAGGDLAQTCSWADEKRSEYRWSSPLHYADNPGDCKFSYASKAPVVPAAGRSDDRKPFHANPNGVNLSMQGTAATRGERRTCAWSEQSTTTPRHWRIHQVHVSTSRRPMGKMALRARPYISCESYESMQEHPNAISLLPALIDVNLLSDDPTESLMFLAHFVGDIHQPLHCGNADDLGGNTIKLYWYTRQSNLHKVRL
jgi:hypothetical protein